MKAIGLDIGTTTICAIVIETETGRVLQTVTEDNDTGIVPTVRYERLQNPEAILNKCISVLDSVFADNEDIVCIGVAGQMHGIVYLDEQGNALSPLYYWQDESGNQPYDSNESFAQRLSSLTGYPMASGFGATTVFCHTVKGSIPPGATSFCTIHDYVVMKLCGNTAPIVHASDAASFGLYDLTARSFDFFAIAAAGLDPSLFPKTVDDFTVAGQYRGVPVSVAIGDNQASFLGSVHDMDRCVLVNVGTGSQISYLTSATQTAPGLEIRPCFEDRYLCVGSSLCGGRAFALLENFLKETASFVFGTQGGSAYPAMDAFLETASEPENPLSVSTRFSGTRGNPLERGSIHNIGVDNFTPQHLIWGVLEGMVSELLDMYALSGSRSHSALVGSGNGLRKNNALKRLFETRFNLPLSIPSHREEAAFGAALFGMTASGVANNIQSAQKIIGYGENE